jgi:hypothetical protein
VGKDVGELCGIEPVGVKATDDIAQIVALEPDAVLYMPVKWDVDDMVRMLEAGINIVTTASFITGRSYGEQEMVRLRTAAEMGGVSIYGTGINPGLASVVALAASAACREVKRISVYEAADCTGYESARQWKVLGFGSPPDRPDLAERAQRRTAVFGDSIEMMAAALKVPLDDREFRLELGLATKDLDLGYMEIAEGTVCGMNFVWTGVVAGKPLIEMGLRWRLGNSMEPNWEINHGYTIEIDGIPDVRLRFIPDENDYTAGTSNPAVNAVPAVVAARPGIVLAGDLPLIAAGSIASD